MGATLKSIFTPRKTAAESKRFLRTFHCVGTCVNSFDEDGECIAALPYRDVSDFAVHEGAATVETRDEFIKLAIVGGDLSGILDAESTVFLHDGSNDIHMMYDSSEDVHYFFTSTS